jgi:hypothetical protein
MLLLQKGLRVSPREFLEPGRELVLTTATSERVDIEGRSGRGLWVLISTEN